MALPEVSLYKFEELPSTADMLRSLCERQREVIQKLTQQLQTATDANAKLSGELLEASEARATALVSLTHAVGQGRELCHRLVHERDTALASLRQLVEVCQDVCDEQGWTNQDAKFQTAIRQSKELLTLVDQLQAAQARVDARKK